MEIRFVNHASFVVQIGQTRLLADPWLEGRAFNDGWGLLCDTDFESIGLEDITHVWFSHEHPDHFHPPSLRRLDPELRAKLTVLFQETIDRKVAEYCSKAGFAKIRELKADRWASIADGVEVMCTPWGGFEDSWICIRTPQGTILNINDCEVDSEEDARQIRDRVGDIDVLFTQFGISAWDGNEEERDRRLAGARQIIDRIVTQTSVLQPKYVVPFASYIWFCHEENAFMNEGLTPIDEVYSAVQSRCQATPIVLHPGDRWTPGADWDSQRAMEKYLNERSSIFTRNFKKADRISEDELIAASKTYFEKLAADSGSLRLRLTLARQNFRRVRAASDGGLQKIIELVNILLRWQPASPRIHVRDLGKSYVFQFWKGLTPVDLDASECDIEVGSEALKYAFDFLWGGQTLLFNGRFRENRPGSRDAIFDYFHYAGYLNSGRRNTWGSLATNVVRRLVGAQNGMNGAKSTAS